MVHSPQHQDNGKNQGSALAGIWGAFLGALACLLLAWAVRAISEKFFTVVLVLAGPMVMAGYRWSKGLKNQKFAFTISTLFTILASQLVTLVMAGGPRNLFVLLAPAYWAKAWPFHLLLSGLSVLFLLGFSESLWIYAAPPSLRPRREANKYAGGLMYNLCPQQLPALEVPRQFYVGGKLTVDGETLRTTPSIKKGRTFSVSEIAGVVLGRSSGSNVLYDKNFQVLAKFAWSMSGSNLLVLYLLEHNVPFDNLPPHLNCSEWNPAKSAPQTVGETKKSPSLRK